MVRFYNSVSQVFWYGTGGQLSDVRVTRIKEDIDLCTKLVGNNSIIIIVEVGVCNTMVP